jgi:hypothetical protein
MGALIPRTRVFAALIALTCSFGCTRQYMVNSFSRPEQRLRAPVLPETNNREELGEDKPLYVTVNVSAPVDSAVILVLRPRVPIASLKRVIGDDGLASVRRSRGRAPTFEDATYAPALLSLYAMSGGDNLLDDLMGRQVSWSAPQNWTIRFTIDRRYQRDLVASDTFIVVRPGEELRLRLVANPGYEPSVEDGQYRARYQWITVPLRRPGGTDCGRDPLVYDYGARNPLVISCQSLNGDGAMAREINATTRSVRLNYWVAGLLGVAAAGLISAISIY